MRFIAFHAGRGKREFYVKCGPWAGMTKMPAGVFRSLKIHNYRIWAAGAFASNVGTWMQRTAQDWMVLTQLTHHSASAVGTVMALQFGPQLLLLPFTGFVADHFNQRRLLLITQAVLAALALTLGVLTITGLIQLWQVYIFAFLFGSASAFDAPVRQTFVTEMVDHGDLINAVTLNSTSFNGARMIGPAIAGIVIVSIGTGWSFIANSTSYVAVLVALLFLRKAELRPNARAYRTKDSFVGGVRSVWSRSDLKAILLMLFLIGTFGLNFPIYISTMAASVFHTDAGGYGFLSSMMAVGTIIGALISAGRDKPRFGALRVCTAVFSVGCLLGALAPSYWLFAGVLVAIGASTLIFSTTTNALMQLSTETTMRGRVMALRMAIAVGGTTIGAPIVGWVADDLGPRYALGVGAASGLMAAFVAFYAMSKNLHQPSECVAPSTFE